jgi:NAD(P)-dependent dehydrogenase (short-subunit alcohol dehydrogenase family)
VLVTGSSGGIGAAVCRRFADAGSEVTGLDVETAPVGATWTHVTCDLSVPGAAHEAATRVSADKPVTCVVHTAAVQTVAPAGAISSADWHRTLQVNLVAVDEIVGACAESLRASSGSVVVVGSVHGTATTRGMTAYAASKAALAGWVRAAAVDLAPRVRVNGVAPGAVRTPMLEAGLTRRPDDGSPEEALATLAAKTPLGVVAEPEAIAQLIWVLADPATMGFVTGAMLLADGGALALLATE